MPATETSAQLYGNPDLRCGDAARDMLIAEIRELARSGKASVREVAQGDIEVNLGTGRLYRLGDVTVTRIS